MRFLNQISIDVAAGAVVCAAFFARLLHAEPNGIVFTVLGITVWMIYTTDHLLDVRGMLTQASTRRHQLHQKYFKVFAGVLLAMGVLDVVLVLRLDARTMLLGLVLSILVAVYLLLHKKLGLFKEIAIAMLYSAGVLLPSVAFDHGKLSLTSFLLIGCFVITAYINLIILSWYEHEQDKGDQRVSTVTIIGRLHSERLLQGLFALQALGILLGLINGVPNPELFCLVTMNLVLLLVFGQPERFRQHDTYRVVCDFVFLIPSVYLIAYS